MKTYKKMLTIMICTIFFQSSIMAKQGKTKKSITQRTEIEELKHQIKNHIPAYLDKTSKPNAKFIILHNPSKSKTTPNLTYAQKSELATQFNDVKSNFLQFAHNTAPVPLHAKESGYFLALDDADTIKLVNFAIKELNKVERDEKIKAKNNYKKKIAHFKKTAQAESLTAVKKLENEIKNNNYELSNLIRKLDDQHSTQELKEQYLTKFNHLTQQNKIHKKSITDHLKNTQQALHKIDSSYQEVIHMIIQNHQSKVEELLHQVNDILQHKGQSITLQKPAEKVTPKPLTKQDIEEIKDPIINDEFIPNIPLDTLADHVMLDLLIEHQEEEFTKKPTLYNLEALEYYTKARNLREAKQNNMSESIG